MAAEHERMAAWYAEHDDETAARMERSTAMSQRQPLADLDAAFQALQGAMSAALDQLDPWAWRPAAVSAQPALCNGLVQVSFTNLHKRMGTRGSSPVPCCFAGRGRGVNAM